MKGRISKTSVDALIAQAVASGKRSRLCDATLTGFVATASPSGTATYAVEYRLHGRAGQNRRVAIGKHGAPTPAEARTLAKSELGRVAQGIDIAAERRAKREKLAALTFTDAVALYLQANGDGTRYWKERAARLRSADVKHLQGKPLIEIRRGDIAVAIDKAAQRGDAPPRLLYGDLRPLFRWLVEREHIKNNPMAGLPSPCPPEARDRVLTVDELRALWTATADLNWPFSSIFRLLLLTGCRREEVAAARWSEIDLDDAAWTIPASRTKNSREHRVPLAAPAIALLDRQAILEIKRLRGYPAESDLVFSTTGHSGPSGFSRAKHALDERMRAILGPRFKPWRTHDLRRTAATGMEDLGHEARVVEAALNHVSGTKAGIVGIYQRSTHRESVKCAFESWADYLLQLVADC
jgi:integrase